MNEHKLSSDELMHYGVLGMRWGHRKYQKSNGSLTSAGKKRYIDTLAKQKSNHQKALETKFRNAGLSSKESEAKAAKRIKTERILLAIGGMTLAAAAAYAARNKIREKTDGIIKAGKALQRVEMAGDGKLHDAFYAAKDKADKTKYAGLLGFTRHQQVGKAYLMNIGVKKDIKIAGRDKAVNTFKKLWSNDSEFRKSASDLVQRNVQGKNPHNGNIKKMYDNFNSNFVLRDEPAVKKFYETLKAEGYGAVRDVNDMKFSGYKAKNPLIVFGDSNNVAVKSIRELTKDETTKKLIAIGVKESAKSLATYGAAGMTIGGLGMYAKDMANGKDKRKRKRGDKNVKL